MRDGEPAAADRNARAAFVVLVAGFAMLSFGIAMLNPPWEAPDEAAHVQNVETLVTGHWYRIEQGAGLEPHQPPLYYLLLAGLQKLSRVAPREPHPVNIGYLCRDYGGHAVSAPTGTPLHCTTLRHDLPQEAADARLVRLLRLPSVLSGVAVLLLTGAIARRLSKDSWTPFVAAAFVAGVPIFVFTSGSVNNDVLVNPLAAATLLAAIMLVQRRPTTTKQAAPYALAFGALSGLLLLAKLYGPAVALTIVASIWLATRGMAARVARRFDMALIASGAFAAVTSWWLLQNERWYGDPLALTQSHDYLAARLGLGYPRHYGMARILLVDVRDALYNTFFYNSIAGHLLWIPLVGAICCLVIPDRGHREVQEQFLLATFVLCGLVALAVVALQTATFRVGTLYLALPALGCLAALGLERLNVRVALRLAVPLIGCLTTIAIYEHGLRALYNR